MAENTTLASDLVKANMAEYGKHILSNHFSSPIDGFKKVKRRIIYQQRHKLDHDFGGVELISNTMRIHPYGDSSIYDTATRMADTFRSSFPLLTNLGKGASYGGDRAASARYVDFRIGDFCREIFFSGINFKTIPVEQTEDLTDIEIVYFIPKIPTALLYESSSIGFGYNSHTLPLQFENVCDIVIDYVSCQNKARWDYRRLASKFVPCLPNQMFIKNRSDLIESYRNGKFDTPIITEGYYTILNSYTAIIHTLAHDTSPKSVRDEIIKHLKDKNSWIAKAEIGFDVLSDNKYYVDFRIMAKRGTNILKVIDDMSGILGLRVPTYIVPNYVWRDTLVSMPPPEVVKIWYKERYRSILGAKKHKQQDLHLEKLKLEAYLVIVDHMDDVVDLLRNNEIDVINRELHDRFKLSLRQIDILVSASISMLMKTNREDLQKRYDKLLKDIEEHDASFVLIDQEIIEEVTRLKKKYKTDLSYASRESNYTGALVIEKVGIIHIDDDVFKIANMYSNTNMRYISYTGMQQVQIDKNMYDHAQSVPYTSSNQNIRIKYRNKPWMFIRTNRTTIKHKDINVPTEKCIISWVSNHPWLILPDGKLMHGQLKQMLTELQPSKILYAFDTDSVDGMIVVSVNKAHPAVIRLQWITNAKDRCRFSPAGETSVLGVVEANSINLLHLPDWHKNSMIEVDTKLLKKTDKLIDANIRNMRKV